MGLIVEGTLPTLPGFFEARRALPEHHTHTHTQFTDISCSLIPWPKFDNNLKRLSGMFFLVCSYCYPSALSMTEAGLMAVKVEFPPNYSHEFGGFQVSYVPNPKKERCVIPNRASSNKKKHSFGPCLLKFQKYSQLSMECLMLFTLNKGQTLKNPLNKSVWQNKKQQPSKPTLYIRIYS